MMEPTRANAGSTSVTRGSPGIGGGLSTQGQAQGCPNCQTMRQTLEDLNRQLDRYSKLLLDCHQAGSVRPMADPECSELLKAAAQRLGRSLTPDS
jgi:hypothetical protein